MNCEINNSKAAQIIKSHVNIPVIVVSLGGVITNRPLVCYSWRQVKQINYLLPGKFYIAYFLMIPNRFPDHNPSHRKSG